MDPASGLVTGTDGNYYGTTEYGGPNNNGTVFLVTSSGSVTAFYSFSAVTNGTNSDGAYPVGNLLLGSDGNFYGTTQYGGASGYGTVFQIIPGPDGLFTDGTLNAIYSFTGGSDGYDANGALVVGSDGNLYGTTENGGNGDGTVFQIAPGPDGLFTDGTLNTIYSFSGTDGADPVAGLVTGSDGNLYGTTQYGANGYGTVFQITPGLDGLFSDALLNTIYSFTGSDGGRPMGALIQANDGNFYGTTNDDGASGFGTVFQITTGSDGQFSDGTLNTIYSFSGNPSGCPVGSLVQGSDGNFYGMTSGDEWWYSWQNATVFQIAPGLDGQFSDCSVNTIYTFPNSYNILISTHSSLVQGGDGNFYGTTQYGGANSNAGTVFQITPGLDGRFSDGSVTTINSLGWPQGECANSNYLIGLVTGTDGNLYGATLQGARYGAGTLFQYVPGSDGVLADGSLNTLYIFTGGSDGGYSLGGLVQGKDGNFYGAAFHGGSGNGTVFEYSLASGSLSTIYSFSISDGANPQGGLAQGLDGNLYGTTVYGGKGYGTVFQITPGPDGLLLDGSLTTLYSFSGNDGNQPMGGLVQGTSDGNFYGTTWVGGTNNNGTVFKITTSGSLSPLYSFTGGNDGGSPNGSLVQGKDGNFYGTTNSGGLDNVGTVFKITSTGSLTTIYSFNNADDGGYPQGGLVMGSDGNFYGTTESGGPNGKGTVFKITPAGLLENLYTFADSTGNNPATNLTFGPDGNLYGIAQGGSGNGGVIFQVTLPPAPLSAPVITAQQSALVPVNGATLTVTVNPNGTNTQVYFQYGTSTSYGLTTAPQSISSGTTLSFTLPGLLQNTAYHYQLVTTSSAGTFYTEDTTFKTPLLATCITLYDFGWDGGSNGSNSYGGLVWGSDGAFYGATTAGGTANVGTVFRITPSGSINSISFAGGSGGGSPNFNPVQGIDGNFYGATGTGGTANYGTIFQVLTSGSPTIVILHSFAGGKEGIQPNNVVQGTDGNFYGTTVLGGTTGHGTFFRMNVSGSLGTLHSFNATTEGSSPNANLVQGTDGNFYATTNQGGANGHGAVLKISTAGKVTRLYSFTGGSDGGAPTAGLIQAGDGNFYGTTGAAGANGAGTIFKITSAGVLTTLHSFNSAYDGSGTYARLKQGTNGSLYGTTSAGGSYGFGTVFKITTNGIFTVLYSFSNGSDGAYPYGGLVQGADGSFYGTTTNSGYWYWNYYGGFYKITETGTLTAPVMVIKGVAQGIPGGNYSTFGNPALNANGHVAFEAVVKGSSPLVTSTSNAGIWADDNNGQRQLIVRTGTTAPGTSGAVFSALGDPVYNNNENLAFLGTLKNGVGDTTSSGNAEGIWTWSSGNGLQLLVRLGSQAPGCPTGAVFSAINELALPDQGGATNQGGVVMLATLETGAGGVSSSDNQGIWAVDTAGNLQLIISKGQTIEGKTVTALDFLPAATAVAGQTRSFNQGTGDLLYRATFSDGSQGIFKVIFPSEQP